jgi:hypothetical protein
MAATICNANTLKDIRIVDVEIPDEVNPAIKLFCRTHCHVSSN